MSSLGRGEWSVWTTTLELVVTDDRLLDAAAEILTEVLAAVDAACNRFRPDSELALLRSRLPRGARVTPVLALLIEGALASARLSAGRVDPTLGASLAALGYDRDLCLVGDDQRPLLTPARPAQGWREVTLVGDVLTVPDGLVLDLGATAKAMAADIGAASIAATLGCGALVGVGGDIATAGCAPPGGWQVTVGDGGSDPDQQVRLSAGSALATSSTQRRQWRRDGHTLHHILDPATGLPAPAHWRTVSVAAPTCLAANTWSTAAIVAADEAPPILEEAGVAVRLVDSTGRVTALGGWPNDGSRVA